jgi:hypothetical protein
MPLDQVGGKIQGLEGFGSLRRDEGPEAHDTDATLPLLMRSHLLISLD